MDFEKYKTLARKVYGHILPEGFETLPDVESTYRLVADLPDPHTNNAFDSMDLFSVANMTGTQLYNIKLTGKSQYKGGKK